MKTVVFYYVRHGKTLFNELGRMQGWCDSPLTNEGIQQAEEARALLSAIPFNVAFSSTSERCRDTAFIILRGSHVPLHLDKGLREMSFGAYEGARIQNHLDEIDPRRSVTYDWSDVGGENIEMLQSRIKDTYDCIFDACKDQDQILIVSHGSIFMHMLPYLFHISIPAYCKARNHKDLPAPNGFTAVFTRTNDTYNMKKLHHMNDEVLSSIQNTV